jgi:hypothetical protein
MLLDYPETVSTGAGPFVAVCKINVRNEAISYTTGKKSTLVLGG